MFRHPFYLHKAQGNCFCFTCSRLWSWWLASFNALHFTKETWIRIRFSVAHVFNSCIISYSIIYLKDMGNLGRKKARQKFYQFEMIKKNWKWCLILKIRQQVSHKVLFPVFSKIMLLTFTFIKSSREWTLSHLQARHVLLFNHNSALLNLSILKQYINLYLLVN